MAAWYAHVAANKPIRSAECAYMVSPFLPADSALLAMTDAELAELTALNCNYLRVCEGETPRECRVE